MSMIVVVCKVASCKHHNVIDRCTKDLIEIVAPYYAFPAPAVCKGYEENEDD